MGIAEGAKEWLLKIALKKVIKKIVPGVLGLALVFIKKANGAVDGAGITIGVDEAVLASAIAGLIGMLQNYIKVKFGVDWI